VVREHRRVRHRAVFIEIESQLGELHADLAVELATADVIDELGVPSRDRVRLNETGDVLAQPGELRGEALDLELGGGAQCRGNIFAGHEPPDGPPGEPEARDPVAEPGIAGHPEQQPSHGRQGTATRVVPIGFGGLRAPAAR
jgi:hypothetical protein